MEMAFKVEAREVLGTNLGHERTIALTFSDRLCHPEFLLQAIVERAADEYIKNHYAEIEAAIDPKVIAAITSEQLGAAVEERLRREIGRIAAIANSAHRLAKRG